MILVYAILVLILLAAISRRDLKYIGQVTFRGSWKLVATIICLFLLQRVAVVFASQRTVFQTLLLVLSHVALLLLVLQNHHIPGALLFAAGIFLNTLVMVANGGWMPITSEAYRSIHPEASAQPHTLPLVSKNIILPRDQTSLWILSDIIPVTFPWRRWLVSVGDIVLLLGIAQFLFFPKTKDEAEPDPSQTLHHKNTQPFIR